MTRDRNRDVFINCPFDSEYKPNFRAICFTVLACGFYPRCALERVDSGDIRYLKICDLIRQSPLGIHDISRTELSSHSNLPRFNMPFELGLFLGCREFGGRKHRSKRMLILDSESYRYQKFLSDIGGQDISAHHGDPLETIRLVREFLQTAVDEPLAGPAHLAQLHRTYLRDLPEIVAGVGSRDEDLDFSTLIWITRWWLQIEEEHQDSVLRKRPHPR